MNFLKDLFVNNVFLINVISLSLGLTGVVLAFIFYFKSKPAKSISSATRTFKIITERSKKIPKLDIKIDGIDTSVVTVTKFNFWNSGNQELKKTDIAEANPLRLNKVNKAKIFKIELNEQTNSANQISVIESSDDQNFYYISFDYLDPGDGGSINIIHNGKTDNEFFLSGSVKGGIVKKTDYSSESQLSVAGPGGPMIRNDISARMQSRFGSIGAIGFGLIFATIGYFSKKNGMLYMGSILLFIGMIWYYYSKRLYPPIKLKSYDEDF